MKNSLCPLIIICVAQFALGHGDDKPGPNGGQVEMPGAYHAELVVVGSSTAKVYLTDINYKDPKVQDSSVKLVHKSGSTTDANCQSKNDHFLCEFAKSVDLMKKGRLELESKRVGQKGIVVTFKLPLEKPH